MRARTSAALAALCLAGCASTPTGDWDMAMISQDQLERASARWASAIDNQGLFSDRALADYVQELGSRLAAHSVEPERPFQFKILKSESPTLAFSLPGGQTYVSRGLLALATSEDELAWVLAHEIGHVTARHARSRASKAELIGFVTSIVTAPLFDPSQTLANAMPTLITPSFSRGDEREADDLGAKMVRAAGLDPSCGARILLSFDGYEELMDLPRSGGVFDTHPGSRDRYERLIQDGALALAPSCKRDYQAHLVGLRLDADSGVYTDAAGDLILPSVGARIAGGAGAKLQVSFPLPMKAELRDPESGVWLRIEEQAGTVLDKPSIQILETRKGRYCIYRRWIDAGGDTYFVYSEFRPRDREDWEPVLAALAQRVRALPSHALDDLPLVPRIALHTVAPGETLEAIAVQYAVWSPELLAIYNDRAPGAPLEPGLVLKVAERQPLER